MEIDDKKIRERMLLKYFLAQIFADHNDISSNIINPIVENIQSSPVIQEQIRPIKFKSKPEERFKAIKDKMIRQQENNIDQNVSEKTEEVVTIEE